MQPRKETGFDKRKQTLENVNLSDWFFETDAPFFAVKLPNILKEAAAPAYAAEKNALIKRADRLVDDVMVFDEEWDMERCPTPYHITFPLAWEESRNGDPEWMWMLNRHKYLITLAKAYALTKDTKYVEKWLELINDWIFYHTNEPGTYRRTSFRTLDTGMRLRNWLFCLDIFRQCPELKVLLSEDRLTNIAVSIMKQSDFLQTAYLYDQTPISNWKVLEMNGVALASIFFAPILDTTADLTYSVDGLRECLTLQFNADGLHWEQSFMYHVDIFTCLLEVEETMSRFSQRALFTDELNTIFAASKAFVKPNKKQSPVGDSDEENLSAFITYASLILSSPTGKYLGETTPSLETLFHYGYYALRDYDAINSTQPTEKFIPLENSGYVFTHTTWQADEVFTMLKAGPQGGGHGHCDFGHFDVQKGPDYLLSDSGRYTYLEGTADEDRQIFKAAPSHNSTTMDHQEFTEQTASWSFGHVAHSLPLFTKKIADKAYVEATHLGYLTSDSAVVTQRKVFYLAENLWLIVDNFITGEEHTYQQYFNFPSTALTQTDKGIFAYHGEAGNVLTLTFPNSDDVSFIEQKAFHAPDYNVKVPSARLETNFKKKTSAVAVSVNQAVTITAVDVLSIGGTLISSDYVSAWKIAAPEFNGYVLTTNLEDEHGSSRKSYTLDGQDIFGSAIVIDSDEKRTYQFKG